MQSLQFPGEIDCWDMQCPPLACANPIKGETDCCPHCDDFDLCSFGNTTYTGQPCHHEGIQYNADDPCVACKCKVSTTFTHYQPVHSNQFPIMYTNSFVLISHTNPCKMMIDVMIMVMRLMVMMMICRSDCLVYYPNPSIRYGPIIQIMLLFEFCAYFCVCFKNVYYLAFSVAKFRFYIIFYDMLRDVTHLLHSKLPLTKRTNCNKCGFLETLYPSVSIV